MRKDHDSINQSYSSSRADKKTDGKADSKTGDKVRQSKTDGQTTKKNKLADRRRKIGRKNILLGRQTDGLSVIVIVIVNFYKGLDF